jgi:hypothetical protein
MEERKIFQNPKVSVQSQINTKKGIVKTKVTGVHALASG